jgi:aldehyde:ferredoxin oxidoreductase
MAPFGFMGKILWVDLTQKQITEELPSDQIYRAYFGGYGLGIYYIYSRLKPNCNPLGPENILGFIPGLFTGTAAPFTGRYMVCGKSPLTGKGMKSDGTEATGGWGDSNSGGMFGPAIKRAGFDAIFFIGVAESPVYLLIDGDKISLEAADQIWGKDAIETDKILKQKYGAAVNVAAIGVAGENKSLIAGIVNDGGRIAARSGLGAVMGSKRLKALCLKGNKKIAIVDQPTVLNLAKQYKKHIDKNMKSSLGKMLAYAQKFAPLIRLSKLSMSAPEQMFSSNYHEYGTSLTTAYSAETGDMPIRNHAGVGYLEWPQKIAREFTGPAMNKYKVKPYGCFGCPVACGAIYKIPEKNIEESHRPEYETLAAFGGLILNNDVGTLLEVNEYLNRAGMDSISAGNTVAFVLECVERGLLTKDEFKCKKIPEGFIPRWNESDYILPLLELMVTREGIGDLLADGVLAAARKIGKGSESFAMAANGQELAMHDGRYTTGMLLTYVADPTPGRHTAACMDFAALGPYQHFNEGFKFKPGKTPAQKGIVQGEFAKFKQSFNALGFCEFSVWNGRYPLFEMFKSIMGWDMTPEEFLTVGHRIQTLRQMFNAREGAIRHEIPKRAIGDPPLTKGPLAGKSVAVEEMIQAYYQQIGFRDDGVPLEKTLEELQLDYAIPDLKKAFGRPEPIINHSLTKENKVLSSGPEAKNENERIQIVVNLSGNFGGRGINEDIELHFPNNPTLPEIFRTLNQHYSLTAFSLQAVKSNQIAVLLNGVRLDAKEGKRQIYSDDIITIVQPLIGG